jgi:hypothetical protein
MIGANQGETPVRSSPIALAVVPSTSAHGSVRSLR